MVYQYGWKTNVFPVPADVAGKHIENLQKEKGIVTSRNLLESARPINSAIHDCYEWDDSVAAENYRITQSGYILRNLVKIVVSDDVKQEKEVRAFVNIAQSDKFTEGQFVDVSTALSNEETRKIVLRKALKELQVFQKRYDDFEELSKVFVAIADLEKDIA